VSPDAFSVLGVRPGASPAEVKSAYRQLVKLYHPDGAATHPDRVEHFHEIRQAYERVRPQLRDESRPLTVDVYA
jgi:curved DNA-binding protein CbpA